MSMEILQQQLAAAIAKIEQLSMAQAAQAAQIAEVKESQTIQPNATHQAKEIEEYKDVQIAVSVPKDVSLDIYKTLPEFNGEREKYAIWRSTAITAFGILKNFETSTRHFEALLIIRNKITGPASHVLNNYNTVFNFDAIIDRLDSTYSDKRPLYMLEQELMDLHQKNLTVDAFYDSVNAKLSAIVNKINMSFKEKETAQAFIVSANEKALRTFITGLNNRRGEILYAANPSTLPEAYARLQTIINDQQRIGHRNNSKFEEKLRNPQFKPIQQRPDSFKQGNYQSWREQNQVKSSSPVEPMEIDRTSTAVNVERNQSSQRFQVPFKRDFSKNNTRASYDQQKKIQRINNVEDEAAYARTIIYDEHAQEQPDNEYDDQSKEILDETSSIFLGN